MTIVINRTLKGYTIKNVSEEGLINLYKASYSRRRLVTDCMTSYHIMRHIEAYLIDIYGIEYTREILK